MDDTPPPADTAGDDDAAPSHSPGATGSNPVAALTDQHPADGGATC